MVLILKDCIIIPNRKKMQKFTLQFTLHSQVISSLPLRHCHIALQFIIHKLIQLYKVEMVYASVHQGDSYLEYMQRRVPNQVEALTTMIKNHQTKELLLVEEPYIIQRNLVLIFMQI